MPRPSKGRTRTPKEPPSSVDEGAAWLRAYAVSLFDKGDGNGVDWAVIAQTMFAAAFSVLDEERQPDRAGKVLRRVEVSVYDRLARNYDDKGPQPLGMTPPPSPKPLPAHRLPEPRNRP